MAHQGEAEGADRLFVTKVPPHITKEDIATHFAKFGVTTDVYVPMAPGMQNHKGIAFVSFTDAMTAQLAINSGPHEINGSEVVVDFAAPRGPQGGPAGRPSQAQAFGGGGYGAPAYGGAMAYGGAPQAYGGGGNNFPGGVDPAAQEGRLFVTKVSPQLQREHLREHFSQFGELTDVYMPQAPGSTIHKGICFVSYQSPTSMQAALAASPHEIYGHQVVVDVAAPRGAAPPRSGGGYGGQAPMAHNPYGAQQSPYGMAYMVQAAPAAAPMMAAPGGTTGTPVPGRLFITKVTPDLTKEDFQAYFGQYGELSDVFVPGGGTKGIAFVTYADTNLAAQVLATQQHQVKPGKIVLVDQALDRPALPGKGGGKGGGYGAAPSAAMAFGGGYAPY